MIDMLTDYLVGGPMQDVIMSTLRVNNTNKTSSYLFVPPELNTDYENKLPLLNWLYDFSNMSLTQTEKYGALLDDLFFFIGHEKLQVSSVDEPFC